MLSVTLSCRHADTGKLLWTSFPSLLWTRNGDIVPAKDYRWESAARTDRVRLLLPVRAEANARDFHEISLDQAAAVPTS